MKRTAFLVALLVTWMATHLPAQELNIGDAAPKLQVKEFVKGDKVGGLEKGKVYVVEFWATWCGPCRMAIPHLTELQKKYKDVTFVGISVYEDNPTGVKNFVSRMGDKMSYRVALDDIPEGKPAEGKMAKGWLESAGLYTIPNAFIVNQEGKIAWYGHPNRVEEALESVVNGKWDIKQAAAERKKKKILVNKMRSIKEEILQAQESGDPKEMLGVLDKAIGQDSKLESFLATAKFTVLLGNEEEGHKALEYGKHLLNNVLKEDAEALNTVARAIIEPKESRPDEKLLKFSLSVALRADELAKSKEPRIASTLAKCYFDNGYAAKAVLVQERLIKLVKGTPAENDASLKERLELYKKAANKMK